MPERPHSRKKTVAEGTAEVKKGEMVQGSAQAGEGLACSEEKPAKKENNESK